ncbi:MAG TPA: hypothetical protein VFS95_07645 [Telluria sp.]|nr:hypothetical protein [Telluria sp.]
MNIARVMTPRNASLLKLGAAMALCAHATLACASQRQYVAYCAAPDGTRFVLRAAYQYSRLAIARSPITRQDDWQVFLIDGQKKEVEAPTTLDFIDANVIDCSAMGVLDGFPVVNMSYRRRDGSWFPIENLPPQLTISGTRAERSDAMNAALAEWQLSPASFALVAPHGARLVYEQAMYTFTPAGDGIVSAVYQSSSTDNGKVWTAPVLSKAAENFDLGKTLRQQRYAAHLIPGGTVGPQTVER